MDPILEKNLELKKIERLFDTGTTEAQVKFCQEFIRKNGAGGENVRPMNFVQYGPGEVQQICAEHQIDRFHYEEIQQSRANVVDMISRRLCEDMFPYIQKTSHTTLVLTTLWML